MVPGDEYHEEITDTDPAVVEARQELLALFEQERERVFYSRQLEVLYERTYFHWVTNRALRSLLSEGVVVSDTRPISTGEVILVNHRRYRYPVRQRDAVGSLVAEFSDPEVGAALGWNGEQLVLGGFARSGFCLVAEEARTYRERTWTATDHDLDFIWEKEGLAYGVEVKNTWGYLPKNEFNVKIDLAKHLGLVPVFAVRMLPRSWILELHRAGGFALVLRWQMYPLPLKDLAKRIASELGLPADAPRRLEAGTMQRVLNFHDRLKGRSV